MFKQALTSDITRVRRALVAYWSWIEDILKTISDHLDLILNISKNLVVGFYRHKEHRDPVARHDSSLISSFLEILVVTQDRARVLSVDFMKNAEAIFVKFWGFWIFLDKVFVFYLLIYLINLSDVFYLFRICYVLHFIEPIHLLLLLRVGFYLKDVNWSFKNEVETLDFVGMWIERLSLEFVFINQLLEHLI